MAIPAPTSLRYPLKRIGENDDYFKIQPIEYKAPGLERVGLNLRTTEESLKGVKITDPPIILPMPSNIQDNNMAEWSSGTLNPLSANLLSLANTAIQNKNESGFTGEIQSILENLSGVVKSGEGQQALASGIAAAALRAATGQGDMSSAISRATGLAFNQNVEVLFNGVSMRPAFSFTFDMVPRSKEESERVKLIIRTLKKDMTARKGKPEETGGGLFVKAPKVFQLQYMSGGKPHPFLHRFKPCALTQMSVNYNGSGQYATYSDATPVHMQLSLQFMELSPIYSENYDELEKQGDTSVGF